MGEAIWSARSTEALLSEFFAQDDLQKLTADAGALLDCPLLVLDDTFHISAHYHPLGFSDALFQDAVHCGEIPYELGAILSQSTALCSGNADYVRLDGSPYRRRFAPLISGGVRLGYLLCIDLDGHLQKIPPEIWRRTEQILAKQLFIETSRQDKPFETAEDILMHLLDGGFSSASYFRLQISDTYLADFHPSGFALIDLTAYHDRYLGKRLLKQELAARFADSHPFLYRGEVFLFLHGKADFSALVEEFHLKVLIVENLTDLFDLPALYPTAHEALMLMMDERFHGHAVCTLETLRTPLLLKHLEGRKGLIAQQVQALAAHDKEKGTQYCQTLYYYLTCGHSLKLTCDKLFAHRNTVLYRVRKMQEDFAIALDEPSRHADLLLGVSLVLFQSNGPDFFL